MPDLDLDAIRERWLNLCGACDAGIGECSHPEADYRPVMLDLVREVERLTRDGEPATNQEYHDLLSHSLATESALAEARAEVERLTAALHEACEQQDGEWMERARQAMADVETLRGDCIDLKGARDYALTGWKKVLAENDVLSNEVNKLRATPPWEGDPGIERARLLLELSQACGERDALAAEVDRLGTLLHDLAEECGQQDAKIAKLRRKLKRAKAEAVELATELARERTLNDNIMRDLAGDDEPVAEVLAAFQAGPHGLTTAPTTTTNRVFVPNTDVPLGPVGKVMLAQADGLLDATGLWPHYTSSACQHGLCRQMRADGITPQCRLICKHGNEHCRHACHGAVCDPCLDGVHDACDDKQWREDDEARYCACPHEAA